MKVYTVHYPADQGSEATVEQAAFVKDGFCWPALFIPVFWLLWHRMWLVLVGYIVAAVAISGVEMVAGDTAVTFIVIAFALYFAAEANNLRRWSLARRGWRHAGEAFGRDRLDAEIRYYQAASAKDAAPAAQQRARPAPWRRTGADEDDGGGFGLFPSAE